MMISLADAERLAVRAFERAGVSRLQAQATARALVAAERDGQKGHGLVRVAAYAAQARAGKVKGDAVPQAEQTRPAALVVDAANGFAYAAIELGLERLIPLAHQNGVAAAAIRRSHHCGQAGLHVERLAEAGLVAFLFANTPQAMAFWGGARPMLGTNPLAFAAPSPEGAPLVIDLALSVAARAKIIAAKSAGAPIPEGWALDAEGRPTTDAAAALKGSLVPVGGAKGAALALMVEILAAAVTGSHYGFEATSFLDAEGGPPEVGQFFLAVDPSAFGPGFMARMSALAAAMAEEAGVRAPGTTRLKNRQKAEEHGLDIAPALLGDLKALAGEAA
ncbi:MAG: Ldh family oxidoreductase [Parvularculaceae bacterium]|nr:Ldh family oxidoreductase [Parvularculaceae bacterium]